MHKLLTAAATALTLSAMGMAAPAVADDNSGRGNRGGYSQDQRDRDGRGDRGYDDRGQGERGYRDRDHDRNDDYGDRRGSRFDFGRHERGFDHWERGWGRDGHRWHGQHGWHDRHGVLPYRMLLRRLARQGYYDVRGLRPSRWGFGWRAFAFIGRGYPVMLRVNPYNGQVLAVRRIGHWHSRY